MEKHAESKVSLAMLIQVTSCEFTELGSEHTMCMHVPSHHAQCWQTLETTLAHIGDDCVMILRLLTAHTPEFSALMETNYGKQRFLTFSCHHSSACTKVVSWLERWLSG